jgi:hypothetical protein
MYSNSIVNRIYFSKKDDTTYQFCELLKRICLCYALEISLRIVEYDNNNLFIALSLFCFIVKYYYCNF